MLLLAAFVLLMSVIFAVPSSFDDPDDVEVLKSAKLANGKFFILGKRKRDNTLILYENHSIKIDKHLMIFIVCASACKSMIQSCPTLLFLISRKTLFYKEGARRHPF